MQTAMLKRRNLIRESVFKNSPWGVPDDVVKLANGIFWITTPSHGGVAIKKDVAKKLLPKEALKTFVGDWGSGSWFWYEEDSDAMIPLALIPGLFDIAKKKVGLIGDLDHLQHTVITNHKRLAKYIGESGRAKEIKQIKYNDLKKLKDSQMVRVYTGDFRDSYLDWERRTDGKSRWALIGGSENTAALPPYATDREFFSDFAMKDDEFFYLGVNESKILKRRNPIGEAKAKVSKEKYSWGVLRKIEVGSSYSIIMHPEVWEEVEKVLNGSKSKVRIKSEDGQTYDVSGDKDKLTFKGTGGGVSGSVSLGGKEVSMLESKNISEKDKPSEVIADPKMYKHIKEMVDYAKNAPSSSLKKEIIKSVKTELKKEKLPVDRVMAHFGLKESKEINHFKRLSNLKKISGLIEGYTIQEAEGEWLPYLKQMEKHLNAAFVAFNKGSLKQSDEIVSPKEIKLMNKVKDQIKALSSVVNDPYWESTQYKAESNNLKENDELNQIKLNNGNKQIALYSWDLKDTYDNSKTLYLRVKYDVNSEKIKGTFGLRGGSVKDGRGTPFAMSNLQMSKKLPEFEIKTNEKIRKDIVGSKDKGKQILKLYKGNLDRDVKSAVDSGTSRLVSKAQIKSFM